MAKRKSSHKGKSKRGGTSRRRRHHNHPAPRRSRKSKGMPLAVKIGLVSLGLGVAGVVAGPLVTDNSDLYPYVSSAMIGGGGLLLNKGNMKKAAPYLLVGGVAAGVTA